MIRIASWFLPWGGISRRDYRLVLPPLFAGIVAVWFWSSTIGSVLALSIGAMLTVSLALLTMRRLYDAGHSRWWILLFLFPLSVDVDLFDVRLAGMNVHLLDVTAMIQLIPVILGAFSISGSRLETGSHGVRLSPL